MKCRWPIHVFALDPREQDQNVAEVSSRRREMQLALAMGFVSGEINANALIQHSRRLETDVETIALNRTIVGFSHNNDTFGWRFQPRVQSLETPGAFGALGQTIWGTPADCDLCHRQLEPGMRECVALVIMPSFVPYVDLEFRSNWYKLTNPRNAALTMKDTMKLSKAITAMRRSRAQCARCAHCYRPGEIDRLIGRVNQLDRELPLQSMRAQVPYENTLGGFEMFNTGVTDLGPELIGWYGAPGVVVSSCEKQYSCGCYKSCAFSIGSCGGSEANAELAAKVETLEQDLKDHKDNHNKTGEHYHEPLPTCEGTGTTLFLVGDNLSVHDTKVIAGGVCIPHIRLISREIMRVTIPSCVNTVEIDGKDYVAVYAATPYGVTNHLHVPVASSRVQDAAESEKKAIEAAKEELANGVSQAIKDELVTQVRGELDSRITAAFSRRLQNKEDITITPADIQLSFDAVRKGGKNQFEVSVTTDTPLKLKAEIDSKDQGEFAGKTLELAVAPYNGTYLGPIREFDLKGANDKPPVFAKDKGTVEFNATLEAAAADSPLSLLTHDLERWLNSNGSCMPMKCPSELKLKGHLYARVDGKAVFRRVEGEITIDIAVDCNCAPTAATPATSIQDSATDREPPALRPLSPPTAGVKANGNAEPIGAPAGEVPSGGLIIPRPLPGKGDPKGESGPCGCSP